MTTFIGGNHKARQAQESRAPSTRRGWSPSRALAAVWAAQAGRVGLWGPIGFGAGAAFWLSAARTPDWRVLASGFAIALALAILAGRIGGAAAQPWRDRVLTGLSWAAGLAAWICAGALACEIRTRSIAAAPLTHEIAAAELTGWVSAIEPRADGVRLKILVDQIDAAPTRLRFVRIATDRAITPGRGFACRVTLRPPEPPLIPSGYDPQRRAFFDQIGATGFAIGRCRIIAAAPPPSGANWPKPSRRPAAAMAADLPPR